MSTGRLMMPSCAGVLRVRGRDLDRDPIQVSQMGRIWVSKLPLFVTVRGLHPIKRRRRFGKFQGSVPVASGRPEVSSSRRSSCRRSSAWPPRPVLDGPRPDPERWVQAVAVDAPGNIRELARLFIE
jgi:hypothetical protein